MIKYEKYVTDQKRIDSARVKIAQYRDEWGVSEAQMARFFKMPLITLRAFIYAHFKSYQEKTLVSIEGFFKDKNGMD
jgi:hypothetical protein